jgi:hypothetical protein
VNKNRRFYKTTQLTTTNIRSLMDSLPQDITIYYCQYLTNPFLIRTLSLVNRFLHNLCMRESQLWNKRCLRIINTPLSSSMLQFMQQCRIPNIHLIDCGNECTFTILEQQSIWLKQLIIHDSTLSRINSPLLDFPNMQSLDITNTPLSFQRCIYAAVFGQDVPTQLQQFTHVHSGENLLIDYTFDMKNLKCFHAENVDMYTIQTIARESRLEELILKNRVIDAQCLIPLFRLENVQKFLKRLIIYPSEEELKRWVDPSSQQQQQYQFTSNSVLEELILPDNFTPFFECILNACSSTLKHLCLTASTTTTTTTMKTMDVDFKLRQLKSLNLYMFSTTNIQRLLNACSHHQLESITIRDVQDTKFEGYDGPHFSEFKKLHSIDLESWYISPIFRIIAQSLSVDPMIKKCIIRGRMKNCTAEELQLWKQILYQWKSVHELALPGELFAYVSPSCIHSVKHLTLDGAIIDTDVQNRIIQCQSLESLSSKADSSITTKSFIHSILVALPYLRQINLQNAEFRKRQYVPPDAPIHHNLKQMKFNLNRYDSDCLKRLLVRLPHVESVHSFEFPIVFDKFCDLTVLLNTIPLKQLSLSIQALTVAGISRYRCHYLAAHNIEVIHLKYDIHLSFEEMLLATICTLYNHPKTTEYSIVFEGNLESNPSLRQYQSYDMLENLQREVKYKCPSIVDQIVGIENKEQLKQVFEQGGTIQPVQYLIDQLCILRRETDELENRLRFSESMMHSSRMLLF